MINDESTVLTLSVITILTSILMLVHCVTPHKPEDYRMRNRLDVGQLIADEVYDHCIAISNRRLPLIEPEFDDEGTDIRLGLNRWQDRLYTKEPGFGPIWRD